MSLSKKKKRWIELKSMSLSALVSKHTENVGLIVGKSGKAIPRGCWFMLLHNKFLYMFSFLFAKQKSHWQFINTINFCSEHVTKWDTV